MSSSDLIKQLRAQVKKQEDLDYGSIELFEDMLKVVEAAEETSRTICKPISMTDALIQLSEIETRIDKALAALREIVGKHEA
jgi:hypothetical protein